MNANVSSVAAVNAKPGRDGISLREALLAANHKAGAQPIYVMFSAALNGKTVELHSGELPPISRSHVELEGLAPRGLPVSVAIDGLHVPSSSTFALLLVQASEVTVRGLRLGGGPVSGPLYLAHGV